MGKMTCPSCHNEIAFKVIPLSNSFEQVVNSIDYLQSSNRFDSVNFSITGLFAGLVVFVFTWWYEIELAGVLVSATILGTGIGLHILKLWLHRPAMVQSRKEGVSMRIEYIDESSSHWLLDELQCDISLEKLQLLSGCLAAEDWKWSRRLVTGCGITQTKCSQLKDKLLKLNYLKPLPNNQNGYEMTGRGRRVFYQLSLFNRT